MYMSKMIPPPPILQRKKKVIALACVIMVAFFGGDCIKRKNNGMRLQVVNKKTENIIYLDELGEGNFTSTGFTYDSKDNTFWIADHGTEALDSLRLIELDHEFSEIRSIVEISNYKNDGIINLQGIAYDKIDDAIWIAVGNDIQEISKSGKVMRVIDLKTYAAYQSNGICMDDSDNTIWVLCYRKYLLHINRDGNIQEVYYVDISDQDMIYMYKGLIYITAGAGYTGRNNYCIAFNPKTKQFKECIRLEQSYAVEGIYVDAEHMYIVNDGAFHSAAIPRTYMSIYER